MMGTPGPTILLVEDSVDDAFIMKRALQKGASNILFKS